MKIATTIIFLFLLAIKAKAQIYISAGGAIGTHRSKDWNTFSSSYRSFVGSNMVKDKLRLGFCKGFVFGVDAIAPKTGYWEGFSGMYAGFRVAKLTSEASAKLNDGTRYFEMQDNQWYVPIGFGVSEKGGFFTGSLGFGVSTASLISTFEYPSGTLSIGQDRYLNGVFSGSSFIAVPGLMFGVGGGRDKSIKIYITGEVNYRFSFGSDKMQEKMYQNAALVEFGGLDSNYEYLPVYIDEFNQNPSAYDVNDDENYFQAKLSGLTFRIGLKLSFF
jgi:hypothetical protein